ncbi:MAG: IscS subfamily cysteine desulfurase [Alphaproteobacteria bacterium]|nr:IscS subfamily cysteine desulfurase [Alphaproteobacteria bacterium]MDP6517766.1 IscS subfamily cysteine desulfurase [Alphaproteobacteria bacterium]
MTDTGESGGTVRRPVYMDYQATTPTDPRVVAAMMPYFTDKPGNPASRSHVFGWEAEAAVEAARVQVAEIIGADSKEIIFTSGATESNNLALKGAAAFYGAKKNHIIALETDHKCVIEACRRLAGDGFEITFLPVRADGLIDLDRLGDAIGARTLMVSAMAAHNEIGVIQPMAEIGAICRERGVLFHSDCAQAVGKMPLDVNRMRIDLMSISAHKVYGPMGLGALYVRRRPRVRLVAQIDGGGQERGLRSGTLPTPLCVGLGEACRLGGAQMATEAERLLALKQRLHDGIVARLDGVVLNGEERRRLPGNLNLSFADIEADSLMTAMPDLAVSSGSACTSASVEPSYVLRALGLGDAAANSSIRFGLGRFTTEAEVDFAIETVATAVDGLRAGVSTWRAKPSRVAVKAKS